MRVKSEFVMPSKTRIGQAEGDYFACMPCMHEGYDILISKTIGRHTHSCRMSDVPSMSSDLLMFEASTGKLMALMDGEYLTTLRTGACAAHSAILYGKTGFSKLGLIGLGNIMTVFLDVLLSKVDRPLTIYLYKYKDQAERFMSRFSDLQDVAFEVCDNYEAIAESSDIVVSAVTQTREDFCSASIYPKGCTVIPIMTRGFQECDLEFDRVFTDEIDQIRGFKYFDRFKSIANTADVIAGVKPGRCSCIERILVYNYGLAALDLYFARQLYGLECGSELDYRPCSEKYFIR